MDRSVEQWPDLTPVVARLEVVCGPMDPTRAGETNWRGSEWAPARIHLNANYDHGDVCRSALGHELQHLTERNWTCDGDLHSEECGWDEGRVVTCQKETAR